MFNDPTSVDQITDNVPDTTSVVIIQTLYHLSLTIDRLEEEVNQQRAEFSDVFNYAIENRQLRQHLRSSQRNFQRRVQNPYPPQPPPHPSDLIEQAKKSPLPLPLPISFLRQLKSTH